MKRNEYAEPTEMAGVAEAETQAAYAWALDDGVDDLPTQRLTSRRITALGIAASLVVIALAGAVALLVLRQHGQPAPAPAPVIETTTPSPSLLPPPPPPPPVTVTVLPPPPPVTVTMTSTAPRATKPSPSPEGLIGHPCGAPGQYTWTGIDGPLVCDGEIWVESAS